MKITIFWFIAVVIVGLMFYFVPEIVFKVLGISLLGAFFQTFKSDKEKT